MRELLSSKQLIEEYGEYLTRFRWKWFGTLSFRCGDLPLWRADRAFSAWISEIQEMDGNEDLWWFRVAERGPSNDKLRFHVLMSNFRFTSKYCWMHRWNEMAGEADLFYFFPLGDARQFILETSRLSSVFDIAHDM